MYGGHIVNDFDRDLCNKYLEYFMRDELLDEMVLQPRVAAVRAPHYCRAGDVPFHARQGVLQGPAAVDDV